MNVVCVGEVLWDVFPDGPRFGGAPANVACHVVGLGGRAEMVSAVGGDELGRRAIARLATRGVGTAHVQRHAARPTGTVTVSLDDAGRASYSFAADPAWGAIAWADGLDRLAADAVCFGTLAQHGVSRETIRRLVAATPPAALRVLDVNLRPPFVTDGVVLESLRLANVVKLSDDELPAVAETCCLSGTDAEVLGALAGRFDLRAVALSRGAAGAALLQDGEWHDRAGEAVDVIDTVGAGDAFTAALTVGLLRGDSAAATLRRACRVAAFVCTQAGATPPLPEEVGNT